MDSVGVCTRPTVVRKKPPSRELKAVMARVPLMPTSQSASERQRAASARGSIWASLLSLSKPSRMACGVMDCSHRRCTGLLMAALAVPAYCTIKRKISSPSRPASQALISWVTSLRRISLTRALRRPLLLSMGLRSKCGGITGRLAKLHLPRLDVELLRRLDLHQVADGRADDVVLALEVFIVLVELPRLGGQGADDVLRHGRLLGNDQGLAHDDDEVFYSSIRCRPKSLTPACLQSGLARAHAHTYLHARTPMNSM